MLPILNIGPLAIQTPGLVLLIGLWLAMSASEKFAPRFNIRPKDINALFLTAIVAGVLGARLGFAARQPSVFIDSPLSLLSPNPMLFDLQAGLLFAGIASLVVAQRRKMPLSGLLNAFALGAAVFFVALALARAASGDGFGAPSDLPWSIELWGERRHPSQFYEAAAALLILIAIWVLANRYTPETKTQPAGLFVIFSALTAAARLFLEAFRGDSVMVLDRFRSAQVVAWLVLALCLAYLLFAKAKTAANATEDHSLTKTEAVDVQSHT